MIYVDSYNDTVDARFQNMFLVVRYNNPKAVNFCLKLNVGVKMSFILR